MLHEIKIKKEFNYSNMENDVMKKISREKFFGELQEHNINLYYLINNGKKDLNYVAKFNFFLRIAKQNHHISIINSLLFLEDEGYEGKKIAQFLNRDMKNELKTEHDEKYKAKKKPVQSIIENYFIY